MGHSLRCFRVVQAAKTSGEAAAEAEARAARLEAKARAQAEDLEAAAEKLGSRCVRKSRDPCNRLVPLTSGGDVSDHQQQSVPALVASQRNSEVHVRCTNSTLASSLAGPQPKTFCRTAEAEAAKAEAERLAETVAAQSERAADLEATNARLEKHVQVGNLCAGCDQQLLLNLCASCDQQLLLWP